MTTSADRCAQEVLEVVPAVLRSIRSTMRSQRSPALSVPQFRALVFIGAQPASTLSRVAEHVGLTRPSASVLVDGLVKRRLMRRNPHPTDRRCVTLDLTQAGRAAVSQAQRRTQAFLAERLAGLPEAQRETIVQAMRFLHPLFVADAVRA
jgi:DNA-binding MarR family transcriptional regulator